MATQPQEIVAYLKSRMASKMPLRIIAKAMAVIRGEADIYLHSGGQYEWDSAAPVAVALVFPLFPPERRGVVRRRA